MTQTDITNELAFELYAQWEDERAAGNDVSLEDICAAHIEMLPEVQKIADSIGTVASFFSAPPCDARPPVGADDINGSWPPGWSKIGHGASSIVFKGEVPTFGTEVAFKVLHTQNRVLSSAGLVRLMKRFELEARILARLKHDGIVRIFKTFNLDGRPVLEMEYLPGDSLDKNAGAVRAQGAVGIARFMERVARAVGFAHAHEIVHRDLKPSNILLDANGLPCVSDFGVAKLIQLSNHTPQGNGSSGESDQSHVGGLTGDGRQPGTKAYMAPEQFDPSIGAITPATDVWALGVIIYELLHGKRPFSGVDALGWKAAVCNGTLPRSRWVWCWRERRLNKIALRCMSRDPAKRYANAAAVADALAVVTRTSWQVLPRFIGVTAVVAAIVVFVLTGPGAKPGLSLPLEVSLAAITRDARDAFQLCLAGKVSKGLFAFADLLSRTPADALELRAAIRANIAGWAGSLARVEGLYTHPELISAIAASGDGRWVAVGDQRGGVVIWDAQHGYVHKRLAGHAGLVLSAAFSRDGSRLITGSYDCTVRVWSVEGPNDTEATNILPIGAWVYAVAFTPDGEQIVTGTAYGAPTADRLAGVSFWNLSTHERVQPPDKKQIVRAFVPDPTGKKLLVLTDDNEAEVWDLNQRRSLGSLIAGGRPAIIRSAAYSCDGKTIATGGDRLLFWDAELLALRTEESREETEVFGFSPDGAVVVRSGGEVRLWHPSVNCFDPLHTPRPTEIVIKVAAGTHLIGVEDKRTVSRLRWPNTAVHSLPISREYLAVVAIGSGDGSSAAVTIAPDAARRRDIGRLRSGIQLWDMRNSRPVGPPIETSDTPPMAMGFDMNGKKFAFQPGPNRQLPLGDRPVRLIEVTSGRSLGEIKGHQGEVYLAKYLQNHPGWITGGADQFVRIWPADLESPAAIKLPSTVECVSVSTDEHGLAVGCADGNVAYLILSAEKVEKMWVRSFGGMIDQVTISPDGAAVVALGRDRRLWAWTVKDGTPLTDLVDARDLTAAFPQPGGTGWVTIHLNGVVRWWPALAAKKPSREWLATEGSRFVSLDPTGSVLIAAEDDQAQAWSIRANLPIGPPVRHYRQVRKAVWGNGNVLTLSQKSVRIWRPIADNPLPDDSRIVAWLTGLTATSPDAPLTEVEWRDMQFVATKLSR